MHGLSLDIGKLDVAFISRNTQTSKRFKIDSKRWKVNWGGKLLTIQDTTRWLGFYLDPFLNWRAHVKIQVQQGLLRQQKVARFMQRWGINRELARTVAWSTSMATAFVCFLIVVFSFTQFVSGFLYFNVTSGALIPRRSTAHREGRRISFVWYWSLVYFVCQYVVVVYISLRDDGR
jgi:hypothetical protein